MTTITTPVIFTQGIASFLLIAAIAIIVFYLYKKRAESSLNVKGTKNLEQFAVDLTEQARKGQLDPVVGRDDEINRATQILTRRTKNNVILIGMPGVGKTAVVEGLASRISAGDVPDVLLNKRVLLLQVSELLAGTKYRGEFEQRIKAIVQEIRNSRRTIILFIDEIHTVTETKGTEGAVNLSDILKPALARGDLQLIGATTKNEYEQYIKPDESWERRFQIVLVDEPTVAESIKILQGIKKNYEDYHHVKISDQAIAAAVKLAKKYIKDRHLPDKAIDVMDEAAAMVNVANKHKKAKLPTVELKHVKEVIADWVNKTAKNIN